MPYKEIIVVDEMDKEVLDFLERLRLAGEFHLRFRDGMFTVKISAETVSEKGRKFLTKGGLINR
ncbi:hypothetical protein ASG19_08700 [Rhizobium sp. Leaf306]|nr:hypothetical protein ASG19_08700 [Rhizobium sp. Leaf306]